MKVLVVVGGRRLLQDPLLEAVEAVRAAGGSVSVISWFPLGPALTEATTAHVELRAIDAARRAKAPRIGVARVDRRLKALHRKLIRPRAGIRRRWDKVLRKAKLDGQAALVHRLMANDARCRALVAEADVVVAGDAPSIRTVWFVARRRPEVEAISGLAALRTFLTMRRDVSAPVSAPRS